MPRQGLLTHTLEREIHPHLADGDIGKSAAVLEQEPLLPW
jgi:hypothetical protein